MKTRIALFLFANMLIINVLAQESANEELWLTPPSDEVLTIASGSSKPLLPAFKPRYVGTSVNTGFMWMPGLGSAFYVAPKVSFQLKPRLFINAGLTAVTYSLTPAQSKEFSLNRSATDVYLFTEGVYLLNEKWSVNGSAMKNVTPKTMRSPFAPSEAVRVGIDYHISPSITIGASVGYSNGSSSAFDRRSPSLF